MAGIQTRAMLFITYYEQHYEVLCSYTTGEEEPVVAFPWQQ
jgi:hypothetical protein